ncbi:hypothetical protein TcWFU_002812 [Taenia crassiceps]|uniref:Uncharacterized protein n=1 Tax=Taenia crassiceps TaxID=6207 RepID=A0ABR4QBF9_9CEST
MPTLCIALVAVISTSALYEITMEEEEKEVVYTYVPENPRSKADEYLAKHGIESIFEKLVERLLVVKPEKPIAFMINVLDEI